MFCVLLALDTWPPLDWMSSQVVSPLQALVIMRFLARDGHPPGGGPPDLEPPLDLSASQAARTHHYSVAIAARLAAVLARARGAAAPSSAARTFGPSP